jgi:hypothetical protein
METRRGGGRGGTLVWPVVQAALVLAPVAFGAFLITAYPLGADQGIYATVADGLRRGLSPYRDLFDLKPPGIYYAYAAALAVFGRGPWAVRWLDVLAAATAALAVWRLGRKSASGPWPAVSAAFLGFAALAAFGFWNLSQPDNLAIAPIAVAYWLVVGRGDRHKRLRLGAAGALFAAAFFLKYTAATALLGIWLYEGISSGRFFRSLGNAVLWSTAGFAAVVAAVLAYFAAAGILPAFWELNFEILPRYSSVGLAGGPLSQIKLYLWPSVRSLIQVAPYVIVPGLVGLAAIVAHRRNPEKWAAALWLATAAIGVLAQRRFYLYHFAVLLPPLAVCGAYGMSAIAASFKKPWFAILGVAAIVASFAPARPYKLYFERYRDRVARAAGEEGAEERFARFFKFAAYDATAAATVGAYIGENTAPDDRIFVWGFDGTIYFLSGRLPAGRYVGYYPAAVWFPPSLRDEFITGFIEDPPLYFVVPRGQRVYPILGTKAGPGALLTSMPRLYKFFTDNYVQTAEFAPYIVYVLT